MKLFHLLGLFTFSGLFLGAGYVHIGLLGNNIGGYCFGKCEQNKQRDFEDVLLRYLGVLSDCNLGDKEIVVLDALAPEFIKQTEKRQAEFELLRKAHSEGNLTEGQKFDYESSAWRVPLSLASQNELLFSKCETDGLKYNVAGKYNVGGLYLPSSISPMDRPSPDGLCLGYVFHPISDYEWERLLEDGYSLLKYRHEIDSYRSSLRHILWSQYGLRDDIETELRNLPVGSLEDGDLNQKIDERFAKERCNLFMVDIDE